MPPSWGSILRQFSPRPSATVGTISPGCAIAGSSEGGPKMSELEDREQIRELHARYALTIDEGRCEEWIACFTPDGAFESPRFGRFAGHENLRKFAAMYTESLSGAQVRHVITNLTLEFETTDRASGLCYLSYYHSKDGKSELASVGDYRDRL